MIGSKKIRPSTPRAVLMANLVILGRPHRAGFKPGSGAAPVPARFKGHLRRHLLGGHRAVTSIAQAISVGRALRECFTVSLSLAGTAAQGGVGGHRRSTARRRSR